MTADSVVHGEARPQGVDHLARPLDGVAAVAGGQGSADGAAELPRGTNAAARSQSSSAGRTRALAPSPLRPPCAARDRLRIWLPTAPSSPRAAAVGLHADDFERVSRVMSVAWAPRTLETYGAGLLLYHCICDSRGVPDDARAPASNDLLTAFIAELAGAYSASAIQNYISGVRAWHLLHRLPWHIDATEQSLLLRGAAALVAERDAALPPPNRITRHPRLPMTDSVLARAFDHLDMTVSLDVAVYSCALCLQWGVARMGELTVPNVAAFAPHRHITIANVRQHVRDRFGNEVTVLHPPHTKSAGSDGEDIYFGAQPGPTDPDRTFQLHLDINKPQPGEHLFVHTVMQGGKELRRPLTESIFLRRFKKALLDAGITDAYSGHSFRIGGTLEYLLRGVPFAVVKVKGRWASDSFQLYLRQHAEIIAPYMQADPVAWLNLVHSVRGELPPVR